nr:translation initiation factor IF-2-like [Aegilops tauschii subsp. strangulata]
MPPRSPRWSPTPPARPPTSGSRSGATDAPDPSRAIAPPPSSLAARTPPRSRRPVHGCAIAGPRPELHRARLPDAASPDYPSSSSSRLAAPLLFNAGEATGLLLPLHSVVNPTKASAHAPDHRPVRVLTALTASSPRPACLRTRPPPLAARHVADALASAAPEPRLWPLVVPGPRLVIPSPSLPAPEAADGRPQRQIGLRPTSVSAR